MWKSSDAMLWLKYKMKSFKLTMRPAKSRSSSSSSDLTKSSLQKGLILLWRCLISCIYHAYRYLPHAETCPTHLNDMYTKASSDFTAFFLHDLTGISHEAAMTSCFSNRKDVTHYKKRTFHRFCHRLSSLSQLLIELESRTLFQETQGNKSQIYLGVS